MLNDSLLFDATVVLSFLWTAIIAALGIAAFGRELLPFKAAPGNSPNSNRPNL